MNLCDLSKTKAAKLNPHLFKAASAPVQFAPPLNAAPRPTTEELKLNKTERAFVSYLRMLRVPQLRIQAVTLKLADDCRFTPDVSYLDENGRMTFVDVKGFQREDALIKIKMAARLFTEFRFVIAKKQPKGGWNQQEVKP